MSTNHDSSSSLMLCEDDAERQQRATGRGDAGNDRLFDLAGQIGADAGDGVAHVVDGFADVAIELELDDGGRNAIGHGRADVVDAGDASRRRLRPCA